jgi:hypothetical protein
MSMEVDLSTPLTREEREYLHMRGRIGDIELADNLHGQSDDPELSEGDGTGPRSWSVTTAEAAQERRERLLAELAELDKLELGAGTDGDDEGLPPYEQWNSRDLNDELKAREMPAGGSNQEKARRLREDDERLAAAEAERQKQ